MKTHLPSPALFLLLAFPLALHAAVQPSQPPYKKADRLRPRPSVVTPAAAGKPPSDAIVLFDGAGFDQWMLLDARNPDAPERPAKWEIDGADRALVIKSQVQTRARFADCHLHLEYRTSPDEPAMPAAKGQKPRIDQRRGNSGIEFGDHPEIQILDSHENDTYPDGQAAAIYGHLPPLVNACLPPGQWHTLDIYYTAPVFAAGEKTRPATYTVLHNNLPVHIAQPVGGGQTACRVRLRPHGGLLKYRNIWIRPLHAYDENKDKPLPENARTADPFKQLP
ncbi:MAG: DUF1080 domain-containing protein [Opitutaceae bacterium]|jgi:hypothetical protein|nr:DUF1080 domain-containing protein [Opitutaceae bacterium]